MCELIMEQHKEGQKRRVHDLSLSDYDFTQYLIRGHERLTYNLLRTRTDVCLRVK